MAEPTTIMLAVKAAAAVVTDKRGRKVIGAIILAVLSPLILAIALICAILGGGSGHNNAALNFAYGNGEIPSDAPAEYREYMESIRACFDWLDNEALIRNADLSEGSLNSERIKAVFYSLHFGLESLDFDSDYYAGIVDCFIGSQPNEDDPDITDYYQITDMTVIYQNLSEFLGRPITPEEQSNGINIYNNKLYGDNIVDDTYSFGGYWSSGLQDIDIQYLGTGAETQVVYFNQADKRWGAEAYGMSGTIASSGCGPTSLAMVVSTLTGQTVNPSEMSAWAYDNGYRAEGNGSYHSLIPEGGRHYGLTVEGASRREGQKVADALAEGKLVVAIMSKGHFTNGGHFIVLRGITSDGEVLVADPASIRRSEQTWPLDLIIDEANSGAGAGGPFWIFS